MWNQDILISEREKYDVNVIKPGLTGWAQINGRDEIEIPLKAELDGEYRQKMSFRFDCKCFFGTVKSVLKHDGVVEGGTGELKKRKKNTHPELTWVGGDKLVFITAHTYLSEESARLGSRVIGVKFRYKRHLLSGKWSTRNLLMKTESGRMVVRTRFRCDYLRAYHPCLMNRESCYECVFSRPERCGDLTIGDFWGIERFDKKLDVEHGVSILQANTEKGKMILSSLKESMAYYPVEWERYRKTFGNSLAKAGGIPMNPKRVAFLQSVREKGFHRAVRAIYPLHRDAALFRIGTIKKKVKTMIRKEQGIRS